MFKYLSSGDNVKYNVIFLTPMVTFSNKMITIHLCVQYELARYSSLPFLHLL